MSYVKKKPFFPFELDLYSKYGSAISSSGAADYKKRKVFLVVASTASLDIMDGEVTVNTFRA